MNCTDVNPMMLVQFVLITVVPVMISSHRKRQAVPEKASSYDYYILYSVFHLEKYIPLLLAIIEFDI